MRKRGTFSSYNRGGFITKLPPNGKINRNGQQLVEFLAAKLSQIFVKELYIWNKAHLTHTNLLKLSYNKPSWIASSAAGANARNIKKPVKHLLPCATLQSLNCAPHSPPFHKLVDFCFSVVFI